ncbi:MAG: hypothetical protein OEN49_11300 [Gammaproteobacteria bacterium]|nr:hypothetical protein [Gammaproteobacteria bacterium]
MKLNTTRMKDAGRIAITVPPGADVIGIIEDIDPPEALVLLIDGTYCKVRKGWPTTVNQQEAAESHHQSKAGKVQRTITPDHRAKLAMNLERARKVQAEAPVVWTREAAPDHKAKLQSNVAKARAKRMERYAAKKAEQAKWEYVKRGELWWKREKESEGPWTLVEEYYVPKDVKGKK